MYYLVILYLFSFLDVLCCVKTARELKLKLLPQCSGLSGGAAIELMARRGDHYAFIFSQVMTRLRDCNFSFAGMKSYAKKLIKLEVDRLSIICALL